MSDAGVAVRKFFGAVLVAVGCLFMVLCGGCAVLFTIAALIEFSPEVIGFLPVPTLLAAIPVLIGWLMYRSGRGLMRDPQPAVKSGDAAQGDAR